MKNNTIKTVSLPPTPEFLRAMERIQADIDSGKYKSLIDFKARIQLSKYLTEETEIEASKHVYMTDEEIVDDRSSDDDARVLLTELDARAASVICLALKNLGTKINESFDTRYTRSDKCDATIYIRELIGYIENEAFETQCSREGGDSCRAKIALDCQKSTFEAAIGILEEAPELGCEDAQVHLKMFLDELRGAVSVYAYNHK